MSDETESARVWREANAIPRRNQIPLMTSAEYAIFEAVQKVEEMPAHPLLTDAVTLLQRARDKVADFVELAPSSPLTPYGELLKAAKELLSSTNWKNAAWPVEQAVSRLRTIVENAEKL